MTSDQERWDERYRGAIASAGEARPAVDWLLTHGDLLDAQPRGPTLELACGLGRNALHLARLGFSVDAVDVSGVAIGHLANAAREEGLPVRARRSDLSRDPFPGSGYQVVVDTYFLDRRLFEPLADCLAPGGLLLFETFLPDRGAGYGPQDPDRILQPGELRTAFPRLAVLDYREGRPDPTTRPVASLVARRVSWHLNPSQAESRRSHETRDRR